MDYGGQPTEFRAPGWVNGATATPSSLWVTPLPTLRGAHCVVRNRRATSLPLSSGLGRGLGRVFRVPPVGRCIEVSILGGFPTSGDHSERPLRLGGW